MTAKLVIRSIALFALLIGIGVLIKTTSLGNMLDKEWIDQAVRGHGLEGEMLFLAAGTDFTAVGMRRPAVAFLACYGFGITPRSARIVLEAARGGVRRCVGGRGVAAAERAVCYCCGVFSGQADGQRGGGPIRCGRAQPVGGFGNASFRTSWNGHMGRGAWNASGDHRQSPDPYQRGPLVWPGVEFQRA